MDQVQFAIKHTNHMSLLPDLRKKPLSVGTHVSRTMNTNTVEASLGKEKEKSSGQFNDEGIETVV